MIAFRRHRRTSPRDAARGGLRMLGAGLLAGLVGTGAMTALQLVTSKIEDEEQTRPPERWSDASAPAQVAEKAAETAGETLPLDRAPTIGNVMHWLYGTSWGAAYALARRGGKRPGFAPAGIGFGTAVWAASYAELVPLGIYKPPWEYPARKLAIDAAFQIVYGVSVAVAFDVLRSVRA